MMELNVFYEDVEILDLDPEFFVLWLSEVCKEEGKVLGDLNLVFCSDAYLLDMNREHLGHDYYTDIITFDYCVENKVNGDLFISLERVEDNARALGVDSKNESNRVVVHGVLHLLGYKDKVKEDELLMRMKEDYYLNKIVPRGTI